MCDGSQGIRGEAPRRCACFPRVRLPFTSRLNPNSLSTTPLRFDRDKTDASPTTTRAYTRCERQLQIWRRPRNAKRAKTITTTLVCREGKLASHSKTKAYTTNMASNQSPASSRHQSGPHQSAEKMRQDQGQWKYKTVPCPTS